MGLGHGTTGPSLSTGLGSGIIGVGCLSIGVTGLTVTMALRSLRLAPV